MTTEKKIPTTEKLAEAMKEAGCSEDMIKKAREGHYDDYKSPLPYPLIQLVSDLIDAGKYVLAEKAKHGAFDAQRWEGDDWASSAEGKETLEAFTPEEKAKLFGIFD